MSPAAGVAKGKSLRSVTQTSHKRTGAQASPLRGTFQTVDSDTAELSEWQFPSAVDVPAASSEIPFLAAGNYTAARQRDGDSG